MSDLAAAEYEDYARRQIGVVRREAASRFLARPAERGDGRAREIREVAVVHPDAIGMRPGAEHHFRVADETFLDEDATAIGAAESVLLPTANSRWDTNKFARLDAAMTTMPQPTASRGSR